MAVSFKVTESQEIRAELEALDETPMFYSRRLTAAEAAIDSELRSLNPGQHIVFRGGVRVTLGLFGGGEFFVLLPSGYRCESFGSVATAVHVRNLMEVS